MGIKWPPVRLGDVVELLTGFPFESRRYTDDPSAPRLLRGDNIVQGRLRWDGAKRWPSDAIGSFGAYWLREGDVVLAMDRPWIEAGLKYAAVGAVDLPALLVQRVSRLRGTDRLDTRFLRYVIGSRAFTEHVLAVQTGTAVPHISGDQIRSFDFELPSLPEQRAIAAILGALDDRIELNQRMNEALEAMARALFDSWFVEFDPVRAVAEGRPTTLPQPVADLFPKHFEDSELGRIPAGWRVGRLGEIVEHVRDPESPLLSPTVEFLHYSIPAFDAGRSPKREWGQDILSLKWRVPAGTILLSKLNPEIERVWMADISPDERAVCSTEFVVLRALAPFTRGYVYSFARSRLFRQQIESLVTGTSKSHQRAHVGAIFNLKVLLPPSAVVEAFEQSAGTLLARTLVSRRESRVLAAIRDALLPRLISGELRVPQAERMLETTSA